MTYGIIETEKDIAEGVAELIGKCVYMRRAVELTGSPPLRRSDNSFEAIAKIITSQMLSVASAGAIWARLQQALPDFTPEALLALADEDLRRAGLSAGKQRTLRALAQVLIDEQIQLQALAQLSEEDVRRALTQVRGIGPWTADIYILFCLGRADGFAAGDLALQKAAQSLLALDDRPSARQLQQLATQWAPWRGIAARQLWQYYSWHKQ